MRHGAQQITWYVQNRRRSSLFSSMANGQSVLSVELLYVAVMPRASRTSHCALIVTTSANPSTACGLEKHGSQWKICGKSNQLYLKIVSLIQQNLISNQDKMNQDYAFRDLKHETQHMRDLIAVLVPVNMLLRGARSFEVTVNLL